MKINRISLTERLNNIRNGYAGDEAYNTEAIIRFARIPFIEYMEGVHVTPEFREMLHNLDIRLEDNMCYQDVAKRVYVLYQSEETRKKQCRQCSVWQCLLTTVLEKGISIMNDVLNDMPKADTHGKNTSRDYEKIKVPRIGLEWRIKEETGNNSQSFQLFLRQCNLTFFHNLYSLSKSDIISSESECYNS